MKNDRESLLIYLKKEIEVLTETERSLNDRYEAGIIHGQLKSFNEVLDFIIYGARIKTTRKKWR